MNPPPNQKIETQTSISKWALDTFGPAKDGTILVKRAAVELDELLEAIEQQDKDEIGRETADIVILLMRLLEGYDLDLMTEVTAKMRINRARKWQSKGDGTGSHIKDD